MKITDDITDMPEWFQFLFGWGCYILLFGGIAFLIWLVGKEAWVWLIVAGSALLSLLVMVSRNY